ncbi:MAG: nucleoside-diphosphate sugar epimerase/dehydratase, partial [Mariprofundaceae bacterium]|nr:nucleoside-diphosphate sugar epimerase/dehydratase [Mariprofundaceae bacterium]
GSRFWLRRLVHGYQQKKRRCVAIYGAGETGAKLVSALHLSGESYVTCFFDDNPELQGQEVAGIHVYSSDEIETVLQARDIQEVIIAMPSATMIQKKNIFNRLEPHPVQVKILPGLDAMINGTVQLDRLRDINVDDLLGRDAVAPHSELLGTCIRDKVVMVTGAGGSIGSELCRQIIKHQPKSLLLFERNEFALYSIDQELKKILASMQDTIEVIPFLGSVQHLKRVTKICKSFAVQTIYHAAAYKHVPLVECNPIEAIQNNIMGTLHMAQSAIATHVERFVLISTDKAVRPTNVMGASKRCAELVLQALQTQSHNTCFSMVRFGNVLGSSGSVVPLFHQQIKRGGPITLTHQNITRYFMTIPEASQLVIQAGAMAEGGDVFVLDMGEPVRIIDLARKMIALSGLTEKTVEHPDGHIAIEETGLRPGEKLYEELLIGSNVEGTEHPLIMRANEEMIAWQELEVLLENMQQASQDFDVQAVRELLLTLVNGYQPETDIHDWVWHKKSETLRVI